MTGPAHPARRRLHVKIADTANKQFTIPDSVIARPNPPTESFTKSSDLVFNYESSPFAFWITRRSSPQAAPLFDTRIASLPKTPIAPSSSDNRTALDGFPLVFEDQYLQVRRLFHNSFQASGSSARVADVCTSFGGKRLRAG